MFFQLGDRKFEGLFAPGSWSTTGNEAQYAEHQLINGKARLHKTGDGLERVSLTLRLRAEYCNPTNELKQLESWQSAGTILPLILGNGQYIKDYVIQSLPRNNLMFLADGTLVDTDLTITLIEYISYSKEEQQALDARKKAFAVGEKETVETLPPQPKTPEADAHESLMNSITEMNAIQNAGDQSFSVSNAEAIYLKMKQGVDKASTTLAMARQKVLDAQNTIQGAVNIVNSTTQAIQTVQAIGSYLNPPVNLTNLRDALADLRTANNQVGYSSLSFTQSVLLRRF